MSEKKNCGNLYNITSASLHVDQGVKRMVACRILKYCILYLITSWTPGFESFRVMSTTVNVVVFVEIYEVDEYFFAHTARETRWMPSRTRPNSARRYRHIARLKGLLTLCKNNNGLIYIISEYKKNNYNN